MRIFKCDSCAEYGRKEYITEDYYKEWSRFFVIKEKYYNAYELIKELPEDETTATLAALLEFGHYIYEKGDN